MKAAVMTDEVCEYLTAKARGAIQGRLECRKGFVSGHEREVYFYSALHVFFFWRSSCAGHISREVYQEFLDFFGFKLDEVDEYLYLRPDAKAASKAA
jgi:hypothetical protein